MLRVRSIYTEPLRDVSGRRRPEMSASDELEPRPNQFMANKHIVATIAILTILLLLIFGQASAWRHFSWSVFWNNARDVSLAYALAAIAMTYTGFVLRAMRWRVLLQPMKTVPMTRLLGPTIVGFTGLALLGRLGELIRPYMIARKERLSVSSQIAALAVERVFDAVSVGALIAIVLVFSPELQSLPYLAQLRKAIVTLVTLATICALALLLLARHGQLLSHVLQRVLAPVSMQLAQRASQHFRLFSSELNMIRDAKSLAQIVILSITTWFVSGLSQLATVHAFAGARHITLGGGILLLGFGVLGSLVQLPGGGSQQLIAIAALVRMFGLNAELAVSCSILGWLTIFMAPVPAGLALLRYEGLTLRGLSRKSREDTAAITP
jgi:glycosyltransferase 2 family protein